MLTSFAWVNQVVEIMANGSLSRNGYCEATKAAKQTAHMRYRYCTGPVPLKYTCFWAASKYTANTQSNTQVDATS